MVMKALEDECYVVIKAYKSIISEIWRDVFVLAYIVCTFYPYIESTDSMIPRALHKSILLYQEHISRFPPE